MYYVLGLATQVVYSLCVLAVNVDSKYAFCERLQRQKAGVFVQLDGCMIAI